jgi:hypothetical protein
MTTTPPARRRALVVVDIAVGVAIALLGLLLSLYIVASYEQYRTLATTCTGITPTGTECDQGFLDGALAIGYAVTVLGWLLTSGMFVVQVIRRRLAWFWPLIGMVVVYVAFWIVTAVVGSAYIPGTGA